MLIVCPSCASEYTIEATHVGPEGRTVRCASCRTTWRALPEAPEAEPKPVEAVPAPAEPTRPAARRGAKPKRGSNTRPKGLPKGFPSRLPRRLPLAAAAALGLVALAGGGLAAREPVVRALPQAARLYAAIGVAVNLRGVTLADVVAYQNPGADGGVLVIEGDVVNPTRHAIKLPELLVEIRDARDAPLYHWTTEAPREALEPAESARFRARLAAPPLEGRKVLVRFAAATAVPNASAPVPSGPASSAPIPPAAAAGH